MTQFSYQFKNESHLTPTQSSWILGKVENLNLIYLGLYGSKIYGLSTPASDTDIKGVYIPTQTELLLGHTKTYQFKNEELNIECEIKPIGGFLNSAQSCDTNCLDMLYTPLNFWLYSTGVWEDLVSLKHDLLAKNMKGLVGYIKTHSAKYSHKIDRLLELRELKVLIENLFKQGNTWVVQDFIAHTDLSKFKYIKPVLFAGRKDMKEQPYLEVIGKKYIVTWSLQELERAVDNIINDYGTRTNKGLETKQDTKALSHSLRVLYQMRSLVKTGDLKFPLDNVDFIMAVKQGKIEDTQVIMDEIDSVFEDCMLSLEQSDLQEEPDISGMLDVVADFVFEKSNRRSYE